MSFHEYVNPSFSCKGSTIYQQEYVSHTAKACGFTWNEQIYAYESLKEDGWHNQAKGACRDAYIHGGSIVGNVNKEIWEPARENIWHSLL